MHWLKWFINQVASALLRDTTAVPPAHHCLFPSARMKYTSAPNTCISAHTMNTVFQPSLFLLSDDPDCCTWTNMNKSEINYTCQIAPGLVYLHYHRKYEWTLPQ